MQTYYNDMRESRDGRIKIQDDSARRTVSVTMTDLKAEDSGTYQCVHYYSGLVLKKISLNVFKGEYLYPTQSQVLSEDVFLVREQHHSATSLLCPELSSFP